MFYANDIGLYSLGIWEALKDSDQMNGMVEFSFKVYFSLPAAEQKGNRMSN